MCPWCGHYAKKNKQKTFTHNNKITTKEEDKMVRWLTVKCITDENVLVMSLKYTPVTQSILWLIFLMCVKTMQHLNYSGQEMLNLKKKETICSLLFWHTCYLGTNTKLNSEQLLSTNNKMNTEHIHPQTNDLIELNKIDSAPVSHIHTLSLYPLHAHTHTQELLKIVKIILLCPDIWQSRLSLIFLE